MHHFSRRGFLQAAGGVAAGLAADTWPAFVHAAAPTPGRVKVGQIGTTHDHASGKMDTLRKLRDDYEVVGIVEPDPLVRRAAQQSPTYRGLPWLTEEQLFSTPGVKVVAVETAVADLIPTAARCIAAGLHVHVDKPAGESLPAFKKLLDDATARRLTVQLGYMFRHNPAFRFCFQAVRDGWLGKIFEVHGVMAKQLGAAERRRNLPFRGGMMFQLGCHLVDSLVRVLGKAQSVTPYGRPVRPELDSLADNQLAVFEYPTATATIRVSVTEVDGGRRRQFVVCGTEGTLEIRPLEPPRLSLVLDRPRGRFTKGWQEVALPPLPGRYDGQLQELAKIARGEAEPEYSAAHELIVQEMVLRASGLSATV